MLRKAFRLHLAALCVCVIAPSLALAFTLKSLIMPGRVIAAHADIEDNCESCHEKSDAQSQSDLCFVCHRDVRNDVAANTGFHGRNPAVDEAACYTCHAEHEGRDADVVGLDIALFEHMHTDFPLTGAHGDAVCSDCHTNGAPFRDAPQQCGGCHGGDDPHKGALGAACGTCHGETAWTEALFDHAKTGFALAGAHGGTACASCHRDQSFAGAPSTCVGCHSGKDVHKGRNGAQCEGCHSATEWAETSFDHAGKTGFALTGSHARLECAACHVTNVTAALPKTCGGCHRNDDPHEGRLGAACSNCHRSTAWQETKFDHVAVAGFALAGAHADLQCTVCHRDGTEAPIARDCAGCHGTTDPHNGQLSGRCETCHAETSWLSSIRFDHGLIAFPLLGKHAALECSACHASAAFHDAGAACVDCHSDNDPHAGSFGQECATCHDPSSWQAWIFDHGATAFPLTGAHSKVGCASCHQGPVSRLTAAADNCGACHRRTDPHGGRFGDDCGSCHTTDTFSEPQRR
jgi:hypothetical protein